MFAIFKHFRMAHVAMTFVFAAAVIAAVRQSANVKIKTARYRCLKSKQIWKKYMCVYSYIRWLVHRLRMVTNSTVEI